ncbi:uncharacterized protein LOC117293341 [Asterias rubens]|uniref:uncharacterized protein LOC117293341 n=1 Tax=Asterias rubens TaxID=7604 RepID=UPI001455739B|nr:uncharacterized protein LOC117293341 [Asterias rubens]
MAAAARQSNQLQKIKDHPTKYPNVSDSYQYSEQLFKDACLALHGIILQDIHLGKKELLKDPKFLQGRLYDTCTYILSRHEKDLEQIILEHDHPKLKYLRSRTVVQPRVDVMLAKRRPELVFVSSLMIRKGSAGYEPDVREPRSDMARLAYMLLERCCRWGFYLWVGTLKELRAFDMVYSFSELAEAAEGTKSSQIVLKRDAILLPRVGKPLPSSFRKTLLVNRVDPEFCLRLYRIEPEMTMWEDKEEDAERLQDFYTGSHQLHTSYGMWGVSEQMLNVRRQLFKVRDYTDAALYDRAHAMLMMARVMFTDLVVVKKLDEREIDETDFMKRVMDKLRTRIREGLRALEDSSSSEEDGR